MKARITFSLLGIQLGSIDLNLDLNLLGDTEDEVVGKTVKAVRKGVKGMSRWWVRGMVA